MLWLVAIALMGFSEAQIGKFNDKNDKLNFTYNNCQPATTIDWWNIAPYIYRDQMTKIYTGIFKTIIEDMVIECCLKDAPEMKDMLDKCMEKPRKDTCEMDFKYTDKPANSSEVLKQRIDGIKDGNGTTTYPMITVPVYGKMTHTTFRNLPYFPVIESPGVIYISSPPDPSGSAEAVMMSVISGWPVLVLTLIMAALSGIVMWALDSYWNPEEFPANFFTGSWEGFWWAFVSMTTVGYGDRAPRSFMARVFAFFWVLVGLVIISIFTATVTTSLTALSLSNSIELYGSNVTAMIETEEQRYGVQNNAKVEVANDVEDFVNILLGINKKDGSMPNPVAGGLIDSYVAGENKEKIMPTGTDNKLRVGTVFDHQYAYGFVLTKATMYKKGEGNSLFQEKYEDAELFSKCMRRVLSTKEQFITKTIQEDMKALPEPAKSAAEEKSSNLFDPSSAVFQKAVFTCLGLIAFLTFCGIIWEYCYWRPKQRKLEGPKKELERIMTPHTSFEELVAAQCQELEDAMISEVMAFYKAFNHKLEEIRKRHLRDDGMGKKESNVFPSTKAEYKE